MLHILNTESWFCGMWLFRTYEELSACHCPRPLAACSVPACHAFGHTHKSFRVTFVQVLKGRLWLQILHSVSCARCMPPGAATRHSATRWSKSGMRRSLVAQAAVESTVCRLARFSGLAICSVASHARAPTPAAVHRLRVEQWGDAVPSGSLWLE